MNFLRKVAVIFLLCMSFYSISYGMENIFYILRSNAPDKIATNNHALQDLKKHYKSIDILISQAYQIDADGLVWGFVEPEVLNFSKKHSMKLMALVTNEEFDPDKVSKFLANPQAEKRAIKAILSACTQYHYYGVQFDFEMVPLRDRDALTNFYLQAAQALRKQGFVVSYALAPTLGNSTFVQSSNFQRRIYENWEGVYNFKALGKSADFVTIMAYNQHGSGTTPGPSAGIRWVNAVIQYALKYIPAQKISLGIPDYSTYWFTGTKVEGSAERVSSQMAGISYAKVRYLLHKYRVHLQWNGKDKMDYAIFQSNWLYQYLFVENALSFKAKVELAQKYNLRGISVYRLGIEDPSIWNILSSQ